MASLMSTLFGGASQAAMFYSDDFRCYSMAYASRPELENGDKVLLPSSSLAMLTRMEVRYPMMFRLSPLNTDRRTHVGVYEFSAAEGQVIVPGWIMRALNINEGAIVNIRNVQLPKGTFVKLRPRTKDFIELSDPRAVLEKHLKKYSCLTKGGCISVYLDYLDKEFVLDVLELKPADAASIIETDLVVDFAAPLDYVEPVRPAASSSAAAGAAANTAPSALQFKPESRSSGADADMDGSGQASGQSAGAGASSGAAAGAGGSASFSSPSDPAARRALAAEAAARRLGGAGGTSPSPSRFAPKVIPFSGEGYTLKDAAAGAGSSSAAAGAGGASPGGSNSPYGGVVLSGTRPGSARPRTANRFEESRKAKAFQGEGRTLQ